MIQHVKPVLQSMGQLHLSHVTASNDLEVTRCSSREGQGHTGSLLGWVCQKHSEGARTLRGALRPSGLIPAIRAGLGKAQDPKTSSSNRLPRGQSCTSLRLHLS